MFQEQSIREEILLLNISIGLKAYIKILILYIRVLVLFILARAKALLCSALYILYKF